MTTFQHTLDAVLAGRKTQTSRLWKPNWYVSGYRFTGNSDDVLDVLSIHAKQGNARPDRLIWHLDHSYSIQPARGKSAVGRYVVTHLAKRDVRTFDDADIEREGFTSFAEFIVTWCGMHDKRLNLQWRDRHEVYTYTDDKGYSGCDPEYILETLQERPASRYTAAVIQFKVMTLYRPDPIFPLGQRVTRFGDNAIQTVVSQRYSFEDGLWFYTLDNGSEHIAEHLKPYVTVGDIHRSLVLAGMIEGEA